MRILYLTANPNRASSNVPTEEWLRLLPQRGLAPVLVSDKQGEFCNWAQARAIPWHIVSLAPPDKRRPWRYASVLWKLRSIVLAARIQLIHSIEHNVYPVAADLARLCRLPVVVGVHCRMERGFGQWAFGGRRKPQRLFFLSSGSRDVCRPAVEGVVPESSWGLLPNGVNVDRHCPDAELGREFRRTQQLGDGLLIGAASWLRPGKQLEHLFQAVAQLRHKQATLVVAGGVAPGEEDYARQVLAQGQRVVGPRLRYLGCLPDLRGFYNALDLYINTSLEETCSISIIESLACGCPVVGYPSISVAEQVLPSGGEIVEQDDCRQLTSAIDRWLTDDSRRASARLGARRQAEERFDIRRLADRLWNEYLQVVNLPSSGAARAAS